jgi:hypothetical protein
MESTQYLRINSETLSENSSMVIGESQPKIDLTGATPLTIVRVLDPEIKTYIPICSFF